MDKNLPYGGFIILMGGCLQIAVGLQANLNNLVVKWFDEESLIASEFSGDF